MSPLVVAPFVLAADVGRPAEEVGAGGDAAAIARVRRASQSEAIER